MPVTPAYIASQVPVPIAVSAPPDQLDCTDTTTTAASYLPMASGQLFDAEIYNQMVAQTAAAFGYACGCYSLASGCTLTAPGSGLLLGVSAGVISCMGMPPIIEQSIAVPDNTTIIFVWALQNATLAVTVTTTPPAANCVYIGNATSSGGNITAVDQTGIVFSQGGVGIRYTNDLGAPTDSPSAATLFYTVTQSGTYLWNGSSYQSVGQPSASQTTASTVTLTTASPTSQVITPSASIDVLLPSTPTAFNIQNGAPGASGYTLTIMDHTGSITYAVVPAGWNVVVPVIAGGAGSGPHYPSFLVPTNPEPGNYISAMAHDKGASVSSLTFSLVSNGSPVVVAVFEDQDPGLTPTVTYNGVSLTQKVGGGESGVCTVSVWTLLAPAVGTHNVVVTPSGACNIAAIAVALTSQPGATNGANSDANGSGTSASTSVATALGGIVLDALACINTSTPTTTQTLVYSDTVGTINYAMSSAYGTGGTVAMGYGIAPTGGYAIAAADVAVG